MHKCIQHVVKMARPSKYVACLSRALSLGPALPRGVFVGLCWAPTGLVGLACWALAGVLRGSHGVPREDFAGRSSVRSGSRGDHVGLSPGPPRGSRGALVGPLRARLGSVGLRISPCHPPSSDPCPPPSSSRALSGFVGLILSPFPVPFELCRVPSGSAWLLPAPSGPVGLSKSPLGSHRWVLKPFGLSWAKSLRARIKKPTRQQRSYSRRPPTNGPGADPRTPPLRGPLTSPLTSPLRNPLTSPLRDPLTSPLRGPRTTH